MSKKLYVVRRDGEVYGILPDKESKKLFELQRDMEKYEIAKVPEKVVMDALYYNDLGRYLSIEAHGYLLFPHEEIGLIEHFETELECASDEIQHANNMFTTYVKFTEKEEKILNLFSVLMTYIYTQERNSGVFISDSRKGMINMPYLIQTWIGMIDDGYLEDPYS